ncbi:MAG: sensor domain-containing diguanylate cyclase [Spirochaetia bacterium]|nr:sensor domain-containing diguanylate cyclase [Spirochaetia bacterium]
MKSLELLSKIALLAVKTDDFNNQITNILKLIGEYTQVSRTYIFIDNEDSTTTSNEFEWCNTDVDPQIKDLQGIPYEVIPSWRKLLIKDGIVFSKNIFELPEDILAILEPQGILSIIIHPLIIENKLKGFIGFDECKINRKWSEEDLYLLSTISGIISNVYNNHYNLIKIKELSSIDALTNTYNRRFIFNQLEKDFVKYNNSNLIFSVTILDIDHFKQINDTYGHVAGDYILKEFTKVIYNNIRKTDLLGRYGGEEFVIITYNSTRDETVQIISKLLEIIRNKTFIFNNQEIKFTFSAGISDVLFFNKNDITIEKIINLADKRLYKAKETGRNKLVYLGEE